MTTEFEKRWSVFENQLSRNDPLPREKVIIVAFKTRAYVHVRVCHFAPGTPGIVYCISVNSYKGQNYEPNCYFRHQDFPKFQQESLEIKFKWNFAENIIQSVRTLTGEMQMNINTKFLLNLCEDTKQVYEEESERTDKISPRVLDIQSKKIIDFILMKPEFYRENVREPIQENFDMMRGRSTNEKSAREKVFDQHDLRSEIMTHLTGARYRVRHGSRRDATQGQ